MQNYQSGEVVLVAFQFTGATETKRRPGLILLDTGDEDIFTLIKYKLYKQILTKE